MRLCVTGTISWQVDRKAACWAQDQTRGVCHVTQTVCISGPD